MSSQKSLAGLKRNTVGMTEDPSDRAATKDLNLGLRPPDKVLITLSL